MIVIVVVIVIVTGGKQSQLLASALGLGWSLTKILTPKKFWAPKILSPWNFDPQKFWPSKILTPKTFDPQNFSPIEEVAKVPTPEGEENGHQP